MRRVRMSKLWNEIMPKTKMLYANLPKRHNKKGIVLLRSLATGLICLTLGLFIAKGMTASAENNSPYFIKVNKQQNCLTIYEKDEDGKYTVPVKAMTCSTGWATPLGTYNTMIKYRWKLLMGDVWGQYSTRIVKGILFHSVWYYEKDPSTLSATQYNKLGTDASHGCIRLTVADAKWIYDNCPVGTTVEIYNSKDPGPLGKPETLKLLPGTGWDPTDLDKNNPFLNKKPTIKGAKNLTVPWGEEANLLKGVKATSTAGTDITSKLTVEGDVDFNTAGKYTIQYAVTDAIGRTRTKKVVVTVEAPELVPTLEGVRDRYATADTVIDRAFALDGVIAYLDDKELPIDDVMVNIVKETEDRYTIEYSVSANSNQAVTASAKVMIDKNAPVIEGIKHRELTLQQLNSGRNGIKKLALEGITVSDDYTELTKEQIKIYTAVKSDYAYLVTYEVFDEAGNQTRETVQFTYFSDTRIDGVANQNSIPAGTDINLDYVSQGVTSSLNGTDTTEQMRIVIDKYSGGVYLITYYTNNSDGNAINIIAYYTVLE
jgi:lipoprotein-anchoring transpeptidase ErfK/SrfK